MNTCINCRHCKVVHFSDMPVGEMYCKCSKDYVDYVTGKIHYKRCETVRQNRAVCDYWEQNGIKGFFQRLFRKSGT